MKVASMSLRYPKTRTVDVTETLAGIRFPDPYRWLEETTEEVLNWQHEQNELAARYVRNWPHFAEVQRLAKRLHAPRRPSLPAFAAGLWFRTTAHARVLVSDRPFGRGRVIFDAARENPSRSASVSWIEPSPDGTVLALGLCADGSELNTIRLVDVATEQLLPQPPTQVLMHSDVSWLGDSAGFFFSAVDGEAADFTQQVFLHRRGGAPSTMPVGIPWLRASGYRTVTVSADGRYAVAAQRQMNTIPVAVARLDVSGELDWRSFVTEFDGTIAGQVLGDDYVAVATDEDFPRGRVVAIPLAGGSPNDSSSWRELVPPSDAVVRTVIPVAGRLLLTEFVDTYARVRVVGTAGEPIGEVPLPGRGTVSEPPYPITTLSRRGHPEKYLFNFSSLTSSWSTWQYDPVTGELEMLGEPTAALEDAVVEDHWATSPDGTRVPYHLVYRRDIDRGVPRPTMIYAYGGFNVPFLPQFPGAMAAFVECGGVFVHAHLRGGAELGLGWWHEGRLKKKDNCFADLYAVAEQLIGSGITTGERLAVTGGSNGGLLSAVAAIQRPDLWKAVVPRVPLLDLIGGCRDAYDRMAIGNEFGDPSDAEEVRRLAGFSPYQLVEDDVDYPAVFLDAGANDQRCPPSQARKFGARLQAATSGGPVFIKVWEGVGHAGGASKDVETMREAEWLAFVMRETGLDPRPVPNDQVVDYLADRSPRSRDVTEMRRAARDRALAFGGEKEAVRSAVDLSVHGVAARLYRPAGHDRGVVVWLHGGGWMSGDLDSCDNVARALANRACCAVLSVAYRLAPEHHYPAALDDAWAATTWAAERFDRVAVGGDSSGGNLGAAVALRARESGLRLALQLLVYPVLDWHPDSPPYDVFRRRYDDFAGVLGFGADSQDSMRDIWEHYVPDPSRRSEPDASPLQAKTFDGVAPAVIISAEHDILRDEGDEYAERLRMAGVPVETHLYPGQIHGFFNHLGLMDDALDAVERSAFALRSAFHDEL